MLLNKPNRLFNLLNLMQIHNNCNRHSNSLNKLNNNFNKFKTKQGPKLLHKNSNKFNKPKLHLKYNKIQVNNRINKTVSNFVGLCQGVRKQSRKTSLTGSGFSLFTGFLLYAEGLPTKRAIVS